MESFSNKLPSYLLNRYIRAVSYVFFTAYLESINSKKMQSIGRKNRVKLLRGLFQ